MSSVKKVVKLPFFLLTRISKRTIDFPWNSSLLKCLSNLCCLFIILGEDEVGGKSTATCLCLPTRYSRPIAVVESSRCHLLFRGFLLINVWAGICWVAVFDLQGGKVNDCSHCCSWVLRIVKIQHLLMSFSRALERHQRHLILKDRWNSLAGLSCVLDCRAIVPLAELFIELIELEKLQESWPPTNNKIRGRRNASFRALTVQKTLSYNVPDLRPNLFTNKLAWPGTWISTAEVDAASLLASWLRTCSSVVLSCCSWCSTASEYIFVPNESFSRVSLGASIGSTID